MSILFLLLLNCIPFRALSSGWPDNLTVESLPWIPTLDEVGFKLLKVDPPAHDLGPKCQVGEPPPCKVRIMTIVPRSGDVVLTDFIQFFVLSMKAAAGIVNRDPVILPDTEVVVEIRDNHGTQVGTLFEAIKSLALPSLALQAAPSTPGGPGPSALLDQGFHENITVAVLGPMGTDAAESVASLATTFEYPQVGFATFGIRFEDPTRFPFFVRTSPTDVTRARSVLALLKHYNLQHVVILVSSESTSLDAANTLASVIQESGIRVMRLLQVNPSDRNPDHWLAAVAAIRESGASVIVSTLQVLYGDTYRARAWADQLGLPSDLLWISWQGGSGARIMLLELFRMGNNTLFDAQGVARPGQGLPTGYTLTRLRQLMVGVITIESGNLGDEHLLFVQVLRELVKDRFGEVFARRYLFPDPWMLFIADGIFSIALAVDRMIRDGYQCCVVGPQRSGKILLDYLGRLHTHGVSGDLQLRVGKARVVNASYANILLQEDRPEPSRALLWQGAPQDAGSSGAPAPPPAAASRLPLPTSTLDPLVTSTTEKAAPDRSIGGKSGSPVGPPVRQVLPRRRLTQVQPPGQPTSFLEWRLVAPNIPADAYLTRNVFGVWKPDTGLALIPGALIQWPDGELRPADQQGHKDALSPESESSLSAGGIVGTVLGSVAAVGAIVGLAIWTVKRNRQLQMDWLIKAEEITLLELISRSERGTAVYLGTYRGAKVAVKEVFMNGLPPTEAPPKPVPGSGRRRKRFSNLGSVFGGSTHSGADSDAAHSPAFSGDPSGRGGSLHGRLQSRVLRAAAQEAAATAATLAASGSVLPPSSPSSPQVAAPEIPLETFPRKGSDPYPVAVLMLSASEQPGPKDLHEHHLRTHQSPIRRRARLGRRHGTATATGGAGVAADDSTSYVELSEPHGAGPDVPSRPKSGSFTTSHLGIRERLFSKFGWGSGSRSSLESAGSGATARAGGRALQESAGAGRYLAPAGPEGQDRLPTWRSPAVGISTLYGQGRGPTGGPRAQASPPLQALVEGIGSGPPSSRCPSDRPPTALPSIERASSAAAASIERRQGRPPLPGGSHRSSRSMVSRSSTGESSRLSDFATAHSANSSQTGPLSAPENGVRRVSAPIYRALAGWPQPVPALLLHDRGASGPGLSGQGFGIPLPSASVPLTDIHATPRAIQEAVGAPLRSVSQSSSTSVPRRSILRSSEGTEGGGSSGGSKGGQAPQPKRVLWAVSATEAPAGLSKARFLSDAPSAQPKAPREKGIGSPVSATMRRIGSPGPVQRRPGFSGFLVAPSSPSIQDAPGHSGPASSADTPKMFGSAEKKPQEVPPGVSLGLGPRKSDSGPVPVPGALESVAESVKGRTVGPLRPLGFGPTQSLPPVATSLVPDTAIDDRQRPRAHRALFLPSEPSEPSGPVGSVLTGAAVPQLATGPSRSVVESVEASKSGAGVATASSGITSTGTDISLMVPEPISTVVPHEIEAPDPFHVEPPLHVAPGLNPRTQRLTPGRDLKAPGSLQPVEAQRRTQRGLAGAWRAARALLDSATSLIRGAFGPSVVIEQRRQGAGGGAAAASEVPPALRKIRRSGHLELVGWGPRRDAFARGFSDIFNLRHSRLVLFFGASFVGEGKHLRVLLVMEYMEGGSLHALLSNDALPVGSLDEVMTLARDVGQAITFLHQNKPPVCGLYLKPSGLLLDANRSIKLSLDGALPCVGGGDDLAALRRASDGFILRGAGEQGEGFEDAPGTAPKTSFGLLPRGSGSIGLRGLAQLHQGGSPGSQPSPAAQRTLVELPSHLGSPVTPLRRGSAGSVDEVGALGARAAVGIAASQSESPGPAAGAEADAQPQELPTSPGPVSTPPRAKPGPSSSDTGNSSLMGLLGTIVYCAPEVLRGEKPTPASDVFSFGILCWKLISRGAPLYPGMSPVAIVRGVLTQDMRPVIDRRKMEANVPLSLLDLIEECWDREPWRRPTMTECLERLERIRSSPEVINIVSREKAAQQALQGGREKALLLRMLPSRVAEALASGQRVEPEHFDCCTIFFCDIVGYTGLASRLAPHEVMDLLHRLYLEFDQATLRHELFKVETIGDSYMVVGNLAQPQPDHALRVARFALDVRDAAARVPVHPDRPDLGTIRIRSGFHSGPVVASVVGDLNPRYCLFGNTVNLASRMESHSVPMGIQASPATYAELRAELKRAEAIRALRFLSHTAGGSEGASAGARPRFGFSAADLESGEEISFESLGLRVRPRGIVNIKGSGPLSTFWVERAAPPLPPALPQATPTRSEESSDYGVRTYTSSDAAFASTGSLGEREGSERAPAGLGQVRVQVLQVDPAPPSSAAAGGFGPLECRTAAAAPARTPAVAIRSDGGSGGERAHQSASSDSSTARIPVPEKDSSGGGGYYELGF